MMLRFRHAELSHYDMSNDEIPERGIESLRYE